MSLDCADCWNRPSCKTCLGTNQTLAISGMQTRKSYEDTGTGKWLMSHIFIASLISNPVYQEAIDKRSFVCVFLSLLSCEKEDINSIYSSPLKSQLTSLLLAVPDCFRKYIKRKSFTLIPDVGLFVHYSDCYRRAYVFMLQHRKW